MYGTLAALKRMLPRDRGVIIQVGSALAYRGIPLQAAYCGAKHAVQGFVDSLRCELLHDDSGVRVTMVQMPALNTPVGMPTVVAIVGNKIAPGVADRYLARTGYDAQQTDEPADPNRPNNLWEPVPGDHGAHGAFDRRASPRSEQLWVTTHRHWLAVVGAGLAGLAWGALSGHRRRAA